MAFTNLNGAGITPRLSAVLAWKLGLRGHTRPDSPSTGVVVPVTPVTHEALTSPRPSLTWLGHASFLLRLGGTTVLIDPVFSPSLSGTVWRNVSVGITVEQLPPIDAVFITHNHRDHMDAPTLKRLGPAPRYVVPAGLAPWFARRGFPDVVELRWWESVRLGAIEATFVPAEHWSRRGAFDLNSSWWGGYVLAHGDHRVYHAGDTAWFDGFHDIAARCGPLTVAALPIGAYEPRWFMQPQHVNPADAVRAFVAVGAKRFVAMHWGTFKLSDEPLDEPPEALRAAWAEADLPAHGLLVPAVGETIWLDDPAA